jgi:hypothetical protein
MSFSSGVAKSQWISISLVGAGRMSGWWIRMFVVFTIGQNPAGFYPDDGCFFVCCLFVFCCFFFVSPLFIGDNLCQYIGRRIFFYGNDENSMGKAHAR